MATEEKANQADIADAKESKPEVKPPASGTELRNRSWRLIYAAGLDYSPKYIADSENGKTKPVDGLIRTPRGYYRLAEDTRDGTRVLLHSWERDQLTGIEKDGKMVLSEEATDVYGVTARKELRGSIFRDDMNHDMRVLEKAFQKDLNLHAEEILIPSDDPAKPPKRKVKLANGHVAFGIMETDEGTWKIRLYNNLRKDWDETARFVQVGTEPENGYKGSILNPGRDLMDKEGAHAKEFDSLEDALKYVQKFWKIESLKLFRGDPSLIENNTLTPWQKIRNSVTSKILQWNDKKLFRDWTRAIGVSVVVGVVSSAMTTPLMGALMGAGAGLGWALIGKTTETAIATLQRAIMDKNEDQKLEALRPYFEQDHVNEYLLNSEQNKKRFRKKLDPEAMQHLRLLNTEEANMIYDDAEPSPPDLRWRDYERLSSAAFRYFGAQFDSTNDDEKDGILVATYPNGLVSLSHIDKENGATRHYVTYNKDYDVIGDSGNYKHLDPALTQMPGHGEIHKITHRQGKDFRYVPLSCEEFIADVSYQTERDVATMRAFGLPLKDLFNCKTCDAAAIEPRKVDALPVEKWFKDAAKSPLEQAKDKIAEEQQNDPAASVAPEAPKAQM